MSTFKLGQRVRIVNPEPRWPYLRGLDATINRLPGDPRLGCYEYGAITDGGDGYNFFAWELAPLTDPKAAEFIESIKKMDHESLSPRRAFANN